MLESAVLSKPVIASSKPNDFALASYVSHPKVAARARSAQLKRLVVVAVRVKPQREGSQVVDDALRRGEICPGKVEDDLV